VLPSTEGTFCDSHASLSPFKQKSILPDAKKTCSPRAPLNFSPTPWDTLEVRGFQVTIRDGWFFDFLKTHWFWFFENVSKSKNRQFQLLF
jgi:hypothetical protein